MELSDATGTQGQEGCPTELVTKGALSGNPTQMQNLVHQLRPPCPIPFGANPLLSLVFLELPSIIAGCPSVPVGWRAWIAIMKLKGGTYRTLDPPALLDVKKVTSFVSA